MRLKSRTKVPPGGAFRYVDADTKVPLQSHSFNNLVRQVIEHRQANGLAVSVDLENAVDENVCDQMPQVCDDGINLFDKAVTFGKALSKWARSGFQVVTEEELERRTKLCTSCPFWGGVGSWGAGTGKCKKCGCSGLKLFWASEHCPIHKW